MSRNNAFARMLLAHLDQLENQELPIEIDNLALNIGGLICDAGIGLSSEKENQVIAALRGGMTEILREYQPEKHALVVEAAPAAGRGAVKASSR